MEELIAVAGKNILQLRSALHITQQELASKAGVSVSYIRNIEHGKGNVTLHIMKQISDVFGIYPFSLLLPDFRLPADWSDLLLLINLPKD